MMLPLSVITFWE